MAMNRTIALAVLCLFLVSAVFPAADALASGGHRSRGGGEHALAERALSLDEAVAQVERRYKARAVRAEENRNDDRVEYRIRLLAEDGRVFEVRIDAATGRED